MKLVSRFAMNGALLALLLQASAASAVTAGQIDTFEDGTTMGWTMGVNAPAAVSNIATGGPAGVGDSFIQIVSDGSGPSGKMTAFTKQVRWLGDYPAAGITSIRMDLRNLGTTPLSIRVAFRGGISQSAPTALSTLPVDLPANGAWTSVVFLIGLANLTLEDGGTAALLNDPLDVRIFHSATAAYPGPSIAAVLGVDNIQAVPEPAMVVQLAAGAMLIFAWAGWRHRRRPATPA